METTTAKLEESKQLLKTNENGEDALEDLKIWQQNEETRTIWLRLKSSCGCLWFCLILFSHYWVGFGWGEIGLSEGLGVSTQPFLVPTTIMHLLSLNSVNPFTPKSDQDRISPYSINTMSRRQVLRIKRKYQLGNYKLIQYWILQTNIMRTVWQTVRRITFEIWEWKG